MREKIKRILAGCLVLALLCCSPQIVYADEAGDGGAVDELVGQNLLKIDDGNIYPGMNKAYKDGYEPKVEKGKVQIILPLAVEQNAEIPSVKVIPDLGATENSPFVYRNYQKTFEKTKEVFLVKFDFDLSAERVNGVYPVILNVNYSYKGSSMTQAFTTFVRITDGKNPNPVEPVVEEKKPTSEPKIIISKCKDMLEVIESGDEFTFTVVLSNTNKQKSVQNMTVTVSSEAQNLTMLADTNVLYFNRLGAGKTLEIPLRFKSDEKTVSGKYPISLEMSYDNSDAVSLSSSGKVEIYIQQKIQVELEVGNIPTEVNAGDTIPIPVQVMNLGRGAIYNARCSLDVPGLTADTSMFLGNMEGGTAVPGEVNAFAGIVNENAQSDELMYGQTSGVITLTYEDESGQEFTVTKDVSLTVNPLVVNEVVTVEKKEDGIKKQLVIGIAAIVAVIAVGTVTPILIKRNKRRKDEDNQ